MALETPDRPAVEEAWSKQADEVLAALDVNPGRGLDEAGIASRRRTYGPNALRETRARSPWLILLAQFRSLIVLLLVAAAVVSFAFHEWLDGIAIILVILVNASIGFFMEWRAVKSMEALRKLGGMHATVRRAGQAQRISAEDLVPGDIVLLEGGDVITADLRVLEASKLQADESMLTGESLPVAKSVEAVPGDAPVAERHPLLFKGTSLTRGSGAAVVVATGMATELGQISSLVAQAKEETTPLEKRLDQLGRKLVGVTLLVAAGTAVMGFYAGKDLLLMIETAIALAVAAIPEGLPIVATIALARGMWRMARRNALVNRLSSVETLGATSVIFTDKTGTLTENRMTVERLALPDGDVDLRGSGVGGTFVRDGATVDPGAHPALRALLDAGVLCNNASLAADGEGEGVGDPLEIALLRAAEAAGIRRPERVLELPEVREEAFDSDTKMMATFHQADGALRVAVKGAAEPVLDACTRILDGDGERALKEGEREAWEERNEALARDGFRVLALAQRAAGSPDEPAYRDLTFLGLVGLLDPPRRDVAAALQACREAGVRVVMVTGDQPATALDVAQRVGLVQGDEPDRVIHGRDLKSPEQMSPEELDRVVETRIFARVSPKQKLDLIAAQQARGSVVAMTGDGVNDAPALKKADIGVAMGQRGTEVAREAADMVLQDDAFSTIVAAVEQGRIIFNNIRNFVVYLMSCNLSEILVVGLATAVNAPLPILPLQILFLNIVTDVFPALALGMSQGDPGVMRNRPRDPDESVLTKKHWLRLAGYSFLMTLAVLAGLGLALRGLGMATERAVSVSFLILAFSQVFHVFNMRGPGTSPFRNEVTRNPHVWGAVALCTLLLLAAVYLPGLSDVLKVQHPGWDGWLLVAGLSLFPYLVGQVVLALQRPQAPRNEAS